MCFVSKSSSIPDLKDFVFFIFDYFKCLIATCGTRNSKDLLKLGRF